MRLLQIIPTYKPAYCYGGVIVSIGLLCEALHGAGHEVLVATTTANGKAELPVHDRVPVPVNGVPVLYFPRWTKDHSQFSPGFLRWLWANARRFDAVHIHSWWNLSALFGTMICLLRGVRPVLSPRGMLSSFTIKGKWKPAFHRLVGRRILAKTFLHATSQAELDECLGLIPGWPHGPVLPNILEIPVLNDERRMMNDESGAANSSFIIQNSSFKMLFLSRIHEKKGIDLLLAALPGLPFEWTLTIAGEGDQDYVEKLKKQAENLGTGADGLPFSKKINWPGWVAPERRFGVFGQADLFVLPSHNENFANVVIESLAVGTPVLVSRHVGLSDYVLEKKLGWACETTVESIREQIIGAFLQKTERERIADAGPAQVRADFSAAVLAEKYVAVYLNASSSSKANSK